MTPPEISKDERNWGMFAHLSSFLGWIGIPFANIIAPLVMWQIKKDEMPFGSSEAKECLNFQISMTLYAIVGFLLIFVVIGIFLLIALAIANIILTIMAAIKANEGIAYRYPLTIRFIN